MDHGLWIRLEDAHLVPDMENSINQLQELYQKKYVPEAPQYNFKESDNRWECHCICGGVNGEGTAGSKKKAKKKAAFAVLVRLTMAAGICEDEWLKAMWESMLQ